MLTEKQEIRRCEIMGWDYPEQYKHGGIRNFDNIDLDTVKILIDEGFLDKNDAQNSSPTAEEFYKLMSKYPSIMAHGYVVSPDRDDCRVTIEGIKCSEYITDEMRTDLINLCRFADTFELEKESFSCWYD